MIKIALFFMITSALFGCASSQRVGDRNELANPIIVNESSSEALRSAAASGMHGLRDLTKDEFEEFAGDKSRLNDLTGRSSSGVASAAITSGLGLASGLSLGHVTGIGLLGALARDDRVSNYPFSGDFDSRYQIPWIEDPEFFLGVLDRALTKFSSEVSDVYGVDAEWSVSLNDRSNDGAVKLSGSRSAKVSFDGDLVSLIVVAGANCLEPGVACEAYFLFKILGKNSPLVARLITVFSQELGSSPLYLPPNREIYQLPAIMSNGQINYLIHK
jgi:hypothetical protein